MIKRFSRVVKELKKTIIRSKALSRDVASIKSSIGGENLVESLASVRDEIARNEKDIKSLYKANKERIKDTINHSRELDKVYLQLAETSLGRKLTFDEYKISWRCVFSSDPILRKRAWEDLYLERRIGLATELKLLSAQYFHGKRDECAGLYVAISSNSVPPEMVEKYFSDGFKNSDRELNEPCEGFREYIKGKGVEVSGPLSGDSIRTQGIVRVAMNVVNSGSGADVSYYSSSVFSKRSTDVFKLLASGELKYAVVNAFNRNKYNFEIIGGTSVNNESVYIIDFTPKKRGLYQGRLYVSIETYALIRADYKYAPNKLGKDFHILGVGYTETNFSGSIYFENNNNNYNLKYFSFQKNTKLIQFLIIFLKE